MKKIQEFLTWNWVKIFLYWLVTSAGTVAECVFLLASVWVSLNATVHALILQIMTEQTTITLTRLSISAFTCLPEIVLGLALHTTYKLVKNWENEWVWAVLFSLPTLIFMLLTVWTLVCSSLEIGYQLVDWMIATRVLAGYSYGVLSMMYVLIGQPDYVDLLTDTRKEYNELRASSSEEIARLASEIDAINQSHFEEVNTLIEQSNQLAERASSLASQGLENHSIELINWLNNDKKTCTIDELVYRSGYSKRKVLSANLKTDSRNKSLIRKSSVIEWLRQTPPPMQIVSVSEYIDE